MFKKVSIVTVKQSIMFVGIKSLKRVPYICARNLLVWSMMGNLAQRRVQQSLGCC